MHHRSLPRVLTAAAVVLAGVAPVTVGSLTAAHAAKKVYDGPDVASYQHPHGKAINWKKVAKAGYDFAFVKATEGTTYRNPNFAGPSYDDYADIAAAGLVHGTYHFARPGFPITSNAKAQASFFASVIGRVRTPATLPPALDLEETGGLNPAQLVTWAQTFELKLRALTGRTPMLYTYPNFWTNALGDPKALARFPLWMAGYDLPAPPVADLWQYTSTAHVKGIEGDVDLSKFLGTSGFPWSTLSDGTVHTPWKAAAPAAPINVAASVLGTAGTVVWKPGDAGTSRITQYTVTALVDGVPVPGKKGTVSVSGTKFAATFPDLAPGTPYTFTVAATNSAGTGAASRPTTVVTATVPTKIKADVPASLDYGNTLSLSAKLVRSDTKKGLAHQPVLLFRRHGAAEIWTQIRKLSTNHKGRVVTNLTPHKSAHLEAVFPGAAGIDRSTIYRDYTVHPSVTASLSQRAATVGESVEIAGTVAPYLAGQKVERQRKTDHGWVVKDKTTVGVNGEYNFTLVPQQAGTSVFRTRVEAGNGRGVGKSPKLHLTVS